MDNSVYMQAMDQRSDGDKMMLKMNNCTTFKKEIPKSLVSMMSSKNQLQFNAKQTFNPSLFYQLNPTKSSLQEASSESKDVNSYPPSCNFDQKLTGCPMRTPYGYPYLQSAYNPTIGSNLNLGQALNFQYTGK
jgi:hypothetical protein